MMIKIGITGGIGSGKSTVAKIFETMGIPVFFADDVAKKIMNEDEELIKKIKDQFGRQIYIDGKLDKSALAKIVFSAPQKLNLLNQLVHPIAIKAADDWMAIQTTPYAIKEAAVIFESGAQSHLDYIIGVQCPTHIRIKRVMERDNVTEEAVLKRMDKQMDDTIKMRLCNFVINNNEQQLIVPQVISLHQQLLQLCAAQ
jgi:dephospho-CoA kinase